MSYVFLGSASGTTGSHSLTPARRVSGVPHYIQLDASEIVEEDDGEVRHGLSDPVGDETVKWTIVEEAPWGY